MSRIDSRNAEVKPLLKDDEKKREKSGSVTLYLSTAVVLLGAMSVGAMLGLTSPLLPSIHKMGPQSPVYLNTMQASWFGACFNPVAMISAYIAGFIMQAIGRKYTSMLSGIPFIVGLLIISFASQIWMLFVGRIITGIGIGIVTVIVPTYIGETSPANIRGMLGSANELCLITGILFVYIAGNRSQLPGALMNFYKGLGNYGCLQIWHISCSVLSWRPLALVAMAPAALLTLLSFFIPETPTYLLTKNKPDAAKIALRRLRSSESNVDEEFVELEKGLKNDVVQASWLEIFKDSSLRTPLLLLLGTMYLQQLTGINCITFYSKSIFLNAGFTNHTQLTIAVLSIVSVQVLMTFVSCLVVGRAGIKMMMVIGGVVMTLSLISFGVYLQLTSELPHHNVTLHVETTSINVTSTAETNGNSNLSWMAVISMVVFISGYAISIGPIAWLLVSEIIPARSKERSTGLIVALNYFLTFIITLEFSNMQVAFTPQGTFWIFAGHCALSIVFTVLFLPETKGKTLEEIEMYFRNGQF